MSLAGIKSRFCGCIGFCTPPVCAHGKSTTLRFQKLSESDRERNTNTGTRMCRTSENTEFRNVLFKTLSHDREKRLLASSCLSVRPHASPRLPTGRLSMKFDTVSFYENLSRYSKFGQNRKKKYIVPFTRRSKLVLLLLVTDSA
jgi:hypothetical protein